MAWAYHGSQGHDSTKGISHHCSPIPNRRRALATSTCRERADTLPQGNQTKLRTVCGLPAEPVPRVDPPREGVLQPTHASRKVGLRRLQQTLSRVFARSSAVFVVLHNGLPPVPSRHHMTHGPANSIRNRLGDSFLRHINRRPHSSAPFQIICTRDTNSQTSREDQFSPDNDRRKMM